MVNMGSVVCLKCGYIAPAGTQYCPACHAAVDPALLQQLHYLYHLMTDLDTLIKNGQGSQTVAQLYQDVAARYKVLNAPGGAPASPVPVSPGVAPATPPIFVVPTPANPPVVVVPVTPAPPQAKPAPAVPTPVAMPPTGAPMPIRTAAPNQAPVQQPGLFAPAPQFGQPGTLYRAPVGGAPGAPFSWSVFLADQAIAIMAYLGAFLALVATLIFEIGGLGIGNLGSQVKLAIVIVVYGLFAIAGFSLRQIKRLRTVSGAYLAVFALLTPLVALAIYLFELQGRVPAVGMVCITAGYATAIYLILAFRTHFATYGYLAWGTLLVAALALIPWAQAPWEWWVSAVAASALAMLAARYIINEPAVRNSAFGIAAMISGVALLGDVLLGIFLLSGTLPESTTLNGVVTTSLVTFSPLAVVVDTGLMIVLALVWGHHLRTHPLAKPDQQRLAVDLADVVLAGLAGLLITDALHWEQVTLDITALALIVVGLLEATGAVVARQMAPTRQVLRIGLYALGLVWTVASIGPSISAYGGISYSTAIAATGVAAVALAIAWFERQPVWLLVWGGFASFAYIAFIRNALPAILGASFSQANFAYAYTLSEFGFALALWGLGITLGFGPRWRTARLMIHIVALANAGYVALIATQTVPHDVTLHLVVLGTFAATSYITAAQQRLPVLTVVALIFGIPALFAIPSPAFVPLVALVGAAWVAGVVTSRSAGWQWAGALYAEGIVASIVSLTQIPSPDRTTIAAWLLIFAVASYALTVLERTPLAGIVPVGYGIGAVAAEGDPHVLMPLALALATLGLIVGRVGGVRWMGPPYAVALAAAIATVGGSALDPGFLSLSLGAFAVMTFIIAAVEARPDALFGACLIGVAAVTALLSWQSIPGWQAKLAFTGLAFLYSALAYVWAALPWLGKIRAAWWLPTTPSPGVAQAQGMPLGPGFVPMMQIQPPRPIDPKWHDARFVGDWLLRAMGLLVGVGAALVAGLDLPALQPQQPDTLAAAGTLVGLTLLFLWRSGDRAPLALWRGSVPATGRICLYLAGECVMLTATMGLRWLGIENIQGLIIAPGSYQLILGVLLPTDALLGYPRAMGRTASVVGTLLLLVPTLSQSLDETQSYLPIYTIILAVEALIIIFIGLGTRNRGLVLLGSAFVGLAAVRGIVLASQYGGVALVIGVLAVLLLGGAAWLSLRARPRTPPTPPPGPGARPPAPNVAHAPQPQPGAYPPAPPQYPPLAYPPPYTPGQYPPAPGAQPQGGNPQR